MKYKTLDTNILEMKINGADGTFEGYLSVFDVIDLQQDKVVPGAFTKTLSDAMQKKSVTNNKVLFPILFNHSQDRPVGGFTNMREDGKGLWVEGLLDLSTADGTMCYNGLKMGYINSMSIGYRTLQDAMEKGTNVRLLKELQLYEGSLVLFPACPEATVTNVKNEGDMCERCKHLEKMLADMLLLETKSGKPLSVANHSALTDHVSNVTSNLKTAIGACNDMQKSLDVMLGQSAAGDGEVSNGNDQGLQAPSTKPGKAITEPLSTKDDTQSIEDFLNLSKQLKAIAK
jgi:HK97 family phage prohead protease